MTRAASLFLSLSWLLLTLLLDFCSSLFFDHPWCFGAEDFVRDFKDFWLFPSSLFNSISYGLILYRFLYLFFSDDISFLIFIGLCWMVKLSLSDYLETLIGSLRVGEAALISSAVFCHRIDRLRLFLIWFIGHRVLVLWIRVFRREFQNVAVHFSLLVRYCWWLCWYTFTSLLRW